VADRCRLVATVESRLVARIKADVRREEILRATCREVRARGFASTRVGDVAASLGVSSGLVFYHFASKDNLLSEAFRYAAQTDLDQLAVAVAGDGPALDRLDRVFRLYSPGGSDAWVMWIDAWSQALRSPELRRVSRELDLRWKETIARVIADGVAAAEFTCPDPSGAAWRLAALLDGLAIQVTVHTGVLSRQQLLDWVRIAAAAELGLAPPAAGQAVWSAPEPARAREGGTPWPARAQSGWLTGGSSRAR
jgi:AcrR family transcriptional regulator